MYLIQKMSLQTEKFWEVLKISFSNEWQGNPVSKYKNQSHKYKFIPRNVMKTISTESTLQILVIRMTPYVIRTHNCWLQV